jgi:hypothetical protein
MVLLLAKTEAHPVFVAHWRGGLLVVRGMDQNGA